MCILGTCNYYDYYSQSTAATRHGCRHRVRYDSICNTASSPNRICNHDDKGNIDIGPTHKEMTMLLLLRYQFGKYVSH